MKELKLKLTEEELFLIQKLKLDKIEDIFELEDELSDYLQLHCITDKNNLTNEGIVCENMLNKIGNL